MSFPTHKPPAAGALMTALREYIDERGVRISTETMDIERPAEFDGVSITLNSQHDLEEGSYYLVHSFGSIVEWSIDFARVAAMFAALRTAKSQTVIDPRRLEAAIAAFRAFEERTSEYAVFVLREIGHSTAIPGYTLFFRADLEAITEFHRHGRAPEWPTFLALWKAEVASGRRRLIPFQARPVPLFQPRPIERQEVKQERGSNRR